MGLATALLVTYHGQSLQAGPQLWTASHHQYLPLKAICNCRYLQDRWHFPALWHGRTACCMLYDCRFAAAAHEGIVIPDKLLACAGLPVTSGWLRAAA